MAESQRSQFGETAEALFLTSGFVYDSAEQAAATFAGTVEHYQYSRFGNPTIAMLEGASRDRRRGGLPRHRERHGRSARRAALAICKAGDRVVAARALFGSCHWIVSTLLPRYGIKTEFVDGADPRMARRAPRPAALVLLETPSNPMLEIIDLRRFQILRTGRRARRGRQCVRHTLITEAARARRRHRRLFGDQAPRRPGARARRGRARTESLDREQLQPFLRNTGPALSPFNAWVLLKGLETLALRVAAASATAVRIADFLAGRAEVERVWYPFPPTIRRRARKGADDGRGTLVSFALGGGRRGAFATLDAFRLIAISNNLGDTKSLATHPATTTHMRIGEAERARLGITEKVIRLSVGLEDPADLEADLGQALAASRLAHAAE